MAEQRFYKIFSPIRDFINDSRATGILLIACTVLSLVLSNLSFSQHFYTGFWERTIHITGNSSIHLPETNLLFINDILMTLFFPRWHGD